MSERPFEFRVCPTCPHLNFQHDEKGCRICECAAIGADPNHSSGHTGEDSE